MLSAVQPRLISIKPSIPPNRNHKKTDKSVVNFTSGIPKSIVPVICAVGSIGLIADFFSETILGVGLSDIFHIG